MAEDVAPDPQPRGASPAARDRVLGPVLEPAALDGAMKDGRLALQVIREVDPAPQASLSVSMPTSVEEVEQLGLKELRALAQQHGFSSLSTS
jgi:hypothetical protein